MKNLIDLLEESVLNRFGQLIFFNETLLKFGNLNLYSKFNDKMID